MKINFKVFIAVLLSSCNIHILDSKHEFTANYKFSNQSSLDSIFLKYKIPLSPSKNYFLVFHTSGCGPCYSQAKYINKLYTQFHYQYQFYAITNESREVYEKYLTKLKIDSTKTYNFEHLYNVFGFRSEMRNLDYVKDPNNRESDWYPTNIIIKNDSIVFISYNGLDYYLFFFLSVFHF